MRTNTPDSRCPCGSGRARGRCGCARDRLECPAPQAQDWRFDDTAAMDAYCMIDRGAVLAALEAQPDVVEEEGRWSCIEATCGGHRTLATLTATADDLLIVRAPSNSIADSVYDWLARMCGEALLTEDGVVVRIGSVGEALPREEDPVH